MNKTAALAAVALAIIVCGSAYGQQTPADDAARKAQLEKDVLDPTASLMSFNIRNIVTPNFYGIPGSANQLQFQPAIPFRAWGTNNILRVTMPFNTGGVPGRGLGDVTIFNLTVFPAKGGRWGIGPVMNFRNNLGGLNTDTFQIGPAVGYVGGKGKWTYGAFNQNLFSGDTQFSAFQPILAYNLGNGWALATGDAQWSVDWNNSRWVNIPIGGQIGKIFKIGPQLCRFTVNPEYNAVSLAGTPHWTVRFGFILLVPAK